jgi:subtilisin family serine protease
VYAQGSDVVNAYPKITYTYVEGDEAGQQQTFSNGLAMWSGTSFSTPLVAGLLAAQKAKNGLSPRQAWTQLFSKATNTAFGKFLPPGAAASAP